MHRRAEELDERIEAVHHAANKQKERPRPPSEPAW